MKKLLFIGLDFHKKTGSSGFLLDLLKKDYAITCCLIDDRAEAPYEVFDTVDDRDFDVLVCWQIMPPRKMLDHYFRFRHISFFPMFDGCPGMNAFEKWWFCRDANIICFSRKLHERLKRIGFSSHYIQYFPELPKESVPGDAGSAFFWKRRDEINLPLIEYLCKEIKLEHVHVHNFPDPGSQPARLSGSYSFGVSTSAWYDNKEDMLRDIASCAFYIAPRQKEGIGMSFLEAMAMGKCVVAPDAPTMNEYIECGKTGLLYDIDNPAPFQRIDVEGIQKSARRYMQQGRCAWEEDKHRIAGWIVDLADVSVMRLVLYFIRSFLRRPIKVLRVLRCGGGWDGKGA